MLDLARREFITLLGGAAAAWPLAARAQQDERMRRVGVLMPTAADDTEGQARIAAFLQGLQQWGWTVGGNMRVDIRWTAGDAERIRKAVTEIVALAPDVIFANTTAIVGPLLQATRTVPIVFAVVADPVGAGYVNSLARPGGNATGFTTFEYGIAGKWLELLKQLAPSVTRAAVMRDAAISTGLGLFGAIQSAAPSVGLEVTPVNMFAAAPAPAPAWNSLASGDEQLVEPGARQLRAGERPIASLPQKPGTLEPAEPAPAARTCPETGNI
jgi:putative tryptophan/tyrosine transport system substrate-binding protein